MIGRREFITLLGGPVAWPVAARAQPSATPVIGFLNSASREGFVRLLEAFQQGLSETGYHEGKNVLVQYRWAEGDYNRLPALAADLVDLRVRIIVATGSVPSALAAKAATETIPIVFVASDPLRVGLVTSLSRPTGNVTGISPLGYDLSAKKLEIAAELVPSASKIGVLMNPNAPNAARQSEDIQAAAQTLGRQIFVAEASRAVDFEAAFQTLVQRHIRVLVVPGDPLFNSGSRELVSLAARYTIPAVYERFVATVGGLISYGPNLAASYQLAGNYAGRILAGAKPGDLPVQQGTRLS